MCWPPIHVGNTKSHWKKLQTFGQQQRCNTTNEEKKLCSKNKKNKDPQTWLEECFLSQQCSLWCLLWEEKHSSLFWRSCGRSRNATFSFLLLCLQLLRSLWFVHVFSGLFAVFSCGINWIFYLWVQTLVSRFIKSVFFFFFSAYLVCGAPIFVRV